MSDWILVILLSASIFFLGLRTINLLGMLASINAFASPELRAYLRGSVESPAFKFLKAWVIVTRDLKITVVSVIVFATLLFLRTKGL